jgi:EmrB/QacA subfamily drug resistance transporter
MVILDVSVVNVALPRIRADLGFTASGLQWVVNAYAIAFAGFLMLGGRAADLYGRRRIFLLGLGLFTGASLVCGLAPNSGTLVGARSVQGIGGAILSPATLTILTTTFEGKRRAWAIGIWSATAAAGGAAGALFGGILTEYLSWRWIFFINIPIGLMLIVAARAFLAERRAEAARRRLDVAGAILVTAGLLTLVYGIVETERYSWGSPHTIAAIGVAAALLAAFLYVEARVAPEPLMPLRLFRSRSVGGANLVIFFLGAAMFSMWYFISLYMQNVLGYSPLKAGLAFVPQTVAIALGAQISSRLVTRVGARPLLVAGPVISAAGFAWLSQITAHGSYLGDLLVPGVLITFGLGLSFTPVTMAATSGLQWSEAGLASGLINTTRQVGGSIGLAALATVAVDRAKTLVATGGAQPNVALTAGFSRAFAISVGLVLAAAGAAALIIPSIRGPAPIAAQPATAPAAGGGPPLTGEAAEGR